MLKQYFSNQTKNPQQLTVVIVVLLVAGIGTVLLLGSHAASPYAAITADSGTVSSGAVSQTCTGASDGKCVIFGGSSEPACTSTLANTTSVGDIATDVDDASGGSVICLAAGTYNGYIEIDNSNQTNLSSYVTLEAAPGATVDLASGVMLTDSSYITIEGFNFTSTDASGIGVNIEGGSNFQILDNNIGPAEDGVEMGAQEAVGGTVLIKGNAIHDIYYPGEDTTENTTVVSCNGGPSEPGWASQGITMDYYDGSSLVISYNSFWNISNHMMQAGSGYNTTVDHNLFRYPEYEQACGGNSIADETSHENIWQIFQGGSNDTFTNNIVIGGGAGNWQNPDEPWVDGTAVEWEVDNSCAAPQPCSYSDMTIDNNLFLDDAGSNPIQVAPVTTNLQIENNTIVGEDYGLDVNGSTSSTSNYTITGNIDTNTAQGADFEVGCGTNCDENYNVSDDATAGPYTGGSGSAYGGMTGTDTTHVANWTPQWQNTTWDPTATSFPPTSGTPPPAGFYQPKAGSIPFTVGYQGTIGPY